MEKYKAISSSYYRGSHAAFVVFDLTSRTSFESVTRWIESYYKSNNPQFQKNVVLIGNKVDLEEQREITTAEAENFAKLNKMVYWETSAKDGKNVEEVFTYIGQILFDTYKDENSFKKLRDELYAKVLKERVNQWKNFKKDNKNKTEDK